MVVAHSPTIEAASIVSLSSPPFCPVQRHSADVRTIFVLLLEKQEHVGQEEHQTCQKELDIEIETEQNIEIH